MKRTVLLICFVLVQLVALAQKNTGDLVPLTPAKWAFPEEKVTFASEEGAAIMKISPAAGKVVARDLNFANGTISFDVKPRGMTFYFHYQDADENECFYMRMGRAGNPNAVERVQYAPVVDGVLLWDLYPHYQSNATFSKDQWNHVKFEINGAQMRVYVNNDSEPALEVERLEGNAHQGPIAFEGDMDVKNLRVTPGRVPSLPALPGIDPTANDSRYIRSWAVSNPAPVAANVDFSYDLLPTPETTWQVLQTERRGLLNLTRAFGRNKERSIVWLKLAVESAEVQRKEMNFGFLDDVWVFLNGQMLYLDKNLQGRLMEKEPGGRCSVENTSFVLPLKKGTNELLIGLANDAYWGRGAVARLVDLEGIEIKPDPTFDSRMVALPVATVERYAGTYILPTGTRVRVDAKGKYLTTSGDGFVSVALYPRAEARFFSRDAGFEVEFVKTDDEKVSGFHIFNNNGQMIMEAKRME